MVEDCKSEFFVDVPLNLLDFFKNMVEFILMSIGDFCESARIFYAVFREIRNFLTQRCYLMMVRHEHLHPRIRFLVRSFFTIHFELESFISKIWNFPKFEGRRSVNINTSVVDKVRTATVLKMDLWMIKNAWLYRKDRFTHEHARKSAVQGWSKIIYVLKPKETNVLLKEIFYLHTIFVYLYSKFFFVPEVFLVYQLIFKNCWMSQNKKQKTSTAKPILRFILSSCGYHGAKKIQKKFVLCHLFPVSSIMLQAKM